MATSCPWGVGAKTKAIIAFESTYGVLPSTVAGIVMPVNSNSVKRSQNLTDASTLRGDRNPAQPIKGNIDVSGDIVVPVDYTAFGYWLKAMFDEPSTTGDEGEYSHVFKVGAGMPSFALEKALPGISKYCKMTGCKISRLSISTGGDGELTATISVVGKDETIGSTSMDSTATVAPFSRAGNLQASVKVGGTTTGKITSFSLDIDFGLDTDGYCIGGGGKREAVCDGIVKISGTLEAFYDGNSALEAENTSLELIFTKGDESMSIKLPEVMFAVTSPEISGPAGVKASVNYSAFYESATEASAVVFTLNNAVEEY